MLVTLVVVAFHITQVIPIGTTQTKQSSTLIIIDPKVEDYSLLLAEANPKDWLVLDESKNAMQQITDKLKGMSGLSSMHIITHGKPGSILLGTTPLNINNISNYKSHLKQWQLSFEKDADLLVYGCKVAANASGKNLIKTIAAWSSLDVAASIDHTGNGKFNANWNLEHTTASIESQFIIGQKAQNDYSGVLTTGGPDIFGYTFIDSNETGGTVTFEDISGSGTATGMGDEDYFNVTMPFSIDFYGTTSANVRLNDNGNIMFGVTSGFLTWTNPTFPTGTYTNIISGYWDDFDPATSGEIYYETKGTAPNRRFIAQWEDVVHYDIGGTNGATFQIVIYEGTNNIDFVYQDVDFGNASYNNGASATIGINMDATDALQYSRNTTSLSGVTTVRYTYPNFASLTWYSYQSGNWNDPDTWTLDGGVTPLYNNPGGDIPSSSDNVVVTNGRLVTIQSTTNNQSVNSLEVIGELDLTSSSGHSFTSISGSGKILMEGSSGSDNYPSGTNTLFADATVGGTLELYGSGFDWDNGNSFNNVILNMDNASSDVVLEDDYTINGNLTLNTGTLQFNNNASTTKLTLDVEGDVTVTANGSITVGTGNTIGSYDIGSSEGASTLPSTGNYHTDMYHMFYVGGNFTNNGNVTLTNQSVPDYNDFTTTGAVNLFFDNAQDNTFSLNGTTDLYNLIIDKGSDQTYILELNSNSVSHLTLFGPNVLVHQPNIGNTASVGEFTVQNPEVRKPIYIKHGTLKLTGDITIPTMVESSGFNFDYYADMVIPQDGQLWIADNNVTVRTTALSSDAEVTGHNGVDDNIWGQGLTVLGKFRISAGLLDTQNSWEGLIFYPNTIAPEILIEGGTVNATWLRDQFGSGKASYTQTGGTMNITGGPSGNNPNTARFGITSSDMTFNMSGGTINLGEYGVPIDFTINCDVGNFSVTGGKVVFDMDDTGNTITTPNANLWDVEVNSTSGSQTLTFASDVKVSNDFTINSNATVDVDNTNDFNLSVGADFAIDASATYDYQNNTTTLDGDKLTNINFGALQQFNNLTVNKSDPTKNVEIFNGAATAIQVNGELRVESGKLDYESYIVNAKGNVYNATSIEGTTGKLLLDGSGAQSITSDDGIFDNVEIDNTNTVSVISGDLFVTGDLTLSDGVFDINTSKLTMSGPSAAIVGTGFSTSKMIMMDGNASDGGLELYMDALETLTYPIGTDANGDTRYTPAVGTFTSFNDDGYINISLADDVLPTSNGSGGTMLSYYWRIEHSDFTTVPTVTNWTFEGSETDDGTGSGSSFPASWRAGKVLNELPFTRSYVNDNSSVDDHTIINDNEGTPFNLDNADYSAGPPNRFSGDPDVYYSRQDGNFNTASTWSKNDDTGAGTQEVPAEGSIVVIQSDKDGSRGHRVNTYAAFDDLGAVQFDHDYTNVPSPDSETVPRFQFFVTETFELGVVSGTGMISFDRSVTPTVNGDFGDFGNNLESYYLYFGGNATVTNVPEPVPNLIFESENFRLNQALTIQGDLVIQGDGVLIPRQDLQVNGDLVIGFWLGGLVRFPGTTYEVDIVVDGNLDYTQDPFADPSDRDIRVSNPGSNTGLAHTLNIKGDILHGSSNGWALDLYNGDFRPWVELTLSGEGNHSYSRSSNSEPQFYTVTIDKGNDTSHSFTFDESFSLDGPTNGNNKALTITNGTCILNDNGINIDLSTGGADFTIPSTGALEITAGTANVSSDGTGIALDGLLTINGGTLDMDDGSGDNNYIVYSSTGAAQINISSGSMIVGSQIRRNTVTTTGVLNYTQTGGTVEIGTADQGEANRGMLEVLNDGSNFTYTGGTLSFERQNTASPTIAALYLDPTTYDVSGSTLYLGTAGTPASQDDFRVNSSIALNNVEINTTNSPTVVLDVRDLTISGNLTIENNATLDGNGLNLTVTGNMTNDGTYTANGNTTTFNAPSSQTYSGSGTATFFNLTKTAAGVMSSSTAYTISNDLNIYQGIYNTSTVAITVLGNVINDGTHSNTSGNGIVMSDSEPQTISRSSTGTSQFGTLTIDNNAGVSVPDGNGYTFVINNTLRLSDGVFNIGGNLLSIATTGSIEEVNTYNEKNMIQTNSSFTDNGVEINFSTISSATDIIFPIGELKYTPVTFTVSSSDAGSLTVRPANEMHPAIVEDIEAPDPEITDEDNVLQYHWIITGANLTNFNANATFEYLAEDALVDAPYTLANYIPARIFESTSTWDKAYSSADFDEGSDEFTVPFTAASDATISGDYTAGVGVDNSDVAVNGAIPDVVPEYETNQAGGGDFDQNGSWDVAIPSGGPIGAIVTVKTGDVLTLNNDDVRLFRTIIESGAVLEIDETTKHRLGVVTGTGKIRIVSNSTNANLPAGYYNDFFDCSGGELEYDGTGAYSIMSGITTLKELTLSGGGTRTLSNNDINICNDFHINGPTLNNGLNRNVTVNNDMNLASGTFNSGISNTISIVGNLNISGGTYNGETGGNDDIGSFNLTNGTFNTGTGGTISISGDMSFTGGTFDGGSSTSKIVLNGAAAQNLTGDYTNTAAFHNLEVDNSNGVAFGGDVDLENTLTLTDGLIDPDVNTFKLGTAATVSPSTGTASAFVNGRLHKEMDLGTSFTFPIGNGTRWGYAGVENVGTGGLTWEAEYFDADPTTDAEVDNITPTDPVTIKTISGVEFWRISDGQSPGSATANVTLRWDTESDVSAVKSERETLTVMEWNDGASTWDNKGGQSFLSGHTQNSGALTSATTITFSEKVLTLGSENIANPLPVELVLFTAEMQGEEVVLNWETATEIDNDYFEVQRSENGLDFQSIGLVEGHGNTTERIRYDYFDENPYYGTSYYRLKQVDFDGVINYSHAVSVNNPFEGPVMRASVYPNPTDAHNIHVKINTHNYNNKVLVKIYDNQGRAVYAKVFEADELTDGKSIVPQNKMSSGVYIFTIEQMDTIERLRVIVR